MVRMRESKPRARPPSAEDVLEEPTVCLGGWRPPSDPVCSPFLPGYDLLGELGRGGMGVVYKARQRELKRLAALKMLLVGALADPDARVRFRAEAAMAAGLQHPNIVQVYEVGEWEGRPFIAFEYVDGGSLKDFTGQPLLPREVAELIRTLACAMDVAHQKGIVHRDLKPANILLQRKPTTDNTDNTNQERSGSSSSVSSVLSVVDFFPKIADFGVAKDLTSSHVQTTTGIICGTPAYMAPEQATGQSSRRLGPAVDVHAWA
jgi:serine/threonine protein kinase